VVERPTGGGPAPSPPSAAIRGQLEPATAAGMFVERRLRLPLLLLPLLLSLAWWEGERLGLYESGFGALLFALANGLVSMGLVAWTVRALNRSDATGRRAAAAVQASQVRLQLVLDGALDAVVGMDSGGRVTFWNHRAETMFGWSAPETLGREVAELIVPPEYRQGHRQGLLRFLATGEGAVIGRRIELSALRRDGSRFPVELTVTAVRDGEAVFFNAVIADLTERHAAAASAIRARALQAAADERYRALVEQANDAIVLLDPSERVLEANRAAEDLFGSPRAVLVGQHYRTFVASDERAHSDASFRDVMSHGSTRVENRTLVRADGSQVAVEVSAAMVRMGGEATTLAILRDVTERVRNQEALRAAAEQYRLLFEGNPHPMWVYDRSTLAFLAVNDAAVRHYGYTRAQFLAMNLRDIRPTAEIPILEQHQAHLRTRDDQPFISPRAWTHRKQSGELIQVEITVSPLDFEGHRAHLVLVTDISERRRLEARVQQSEKMETVGRLAGGVAHDFNNLLGVIVGYGELLARRLPADPRLHKYIGDILAAAERAGALTRQLLAFSRRQVLQPRIVDLNQVVAEMDTMLRRLIGEDVDLVTQLQPELGCINADPGQLEQILMNLAVNARDAMPQGGTLTIATANVLLAAEDGPTDPDWRPGPYVCLTVSDDGHGMTAEVQARLFEPFFTTKEAGRGTGLGLATVHGIVSQSGGHLTVESTAGQGARFQVFLPETADPHSAAAPAPGTAELLAGTETVLLVEDETSLRNIVCECLEASGYRVLSAGSGPEALAIHHREAVVDLLITDVVMPGMGGRDLAERLSVDRPGLRVIYMSGYTDDAVVRHGVLSDQVAFLQKPFTTHALAEKVRAVLEA
jgi:PAS domain S-box-containing protein